MFLVALVIPWIRIVGYGFFCLFLLRKWTVVLGLTLSLAAWLAFQKYYAGDPFYFLKLQQDFGMPAGNISHGFIQAYNDFRSSVHSIFEHLGNASDGSAFSIKLWIEFFNQPGKQEAVATGLLPFSVFLFLGSILIWCLITGRSLIGLVGASVFILSHNQAFWRSTIRYDWPLFMIANAFLLHQVMQHKRMAKVFWVGTTTMILGISFLLQLWYGYAFMKGGWAF
jgi:hypothetical protein